MANSRTDALLDESQRLTAELQARSVELQAQQDKLQRSNAELEDKAEQLARQNSDIETKNAEIERARQEIEERAQQLAIRPFPPGPRPSPACSCWKARGLLFPVCATVLRTPPKADLPEPKSSDCGRIRGDLSVAFAENSPQIPRAETLRGLRSSNGVRSKT